MAQYPLVSIIIPVYNMEEHLPQTLDSVLSTTYPALEVVVMDDGSRDSSHEIAQKYAAWDSRLRAYTQPNSGVCAARNNAIKIAQGEFIMPVDGDDIITSDFVELAVEQMLLDSEVKVVAPKSNFIGDREGEWKLPPFSLNLLARRNMLCVTALYRKSDWERIGGYCDEVIANEDWEFWISMLKDGGRVVRLDKVVFYYRRQAGSKRIRDRKLKKHVIDTLNRRHSEFFKRELGGKLHYQRSWSKVFNWFNRIFKRS